MPTPQPKTDQTKPAEKSALVKRPNSALLDKIVSETEQGRSSTQQEVVAAGLTDIIRRSPELRENTFSASIEDLILQRIATIDSVVSKQLDKVMHAPAFQQLEASWRGLNHL